MGREKRARLKRLLKNLSLLTSPRIVLSEKKQIAITNNTTYNYGKRIGMIMESIHA
jgi:hypothetical protein